MHIPDPYSTDSLSLVEGIKEQEESAVQCCELWLFQGPAPRSFAAGLLAGFSLPSLWEIL